MVKLNEFLVRFTNLLLAVVGTLLGLRFILRLFGANSGNDFVSWIYDMRQPLIAPFENIFPTVRIEDGFVIEITTLFALLIYGLLASLIFYLLSLAAPTDTKTKKVVRK